MGHFKSNVRDLEFNSSNFSRSRRFWTVQTSATSTETLFGRCLPKLARLAEGPVVESFAETDRHPPVFHPEAHTVTIPESFKKSVRAWEQGEWFRVGLSEEVGGMPPQRQ